ncbi:hypothetical protein E2P81_ATG01626 [Venturia nashicola]|nr:hypothetical protein E2P81_ATG01626 [Venturia nashicola]
MTDVEVRSFSNYGTELVTIDVGPEKTAFHIHKGILTSESPYFKAAFDGEFREATEKRIHLADTTSAIFQDFMDWLYFGSLPDGEVSEDPGSTHEETNCCFCEGPYRRPPGHANSPFATLSVDDDKELEDYLIRYPQRNYKLYIFADSYDIPALRKKIVDCEYCRYRLYSDNLPWNTDYVYALRNLPTTSMLVKLLVDLYVDRHEAEDLEYRCGTEILLQGKFPPEFLSMVIDVHSALKRKSDQKALKTLCVYHEHPQGHSVIQACVDAQKAGRDKRRAALEVEELEVGGIGVENLEVEDKHEAGS